MITKYLIYLTIFSAPLYLIKFSVFGIPTNILDILMSTTILFAIFNNLREKNTRNNILFKKSKLTYVAFSILLILSGLIISTLTSNNNPHSWGIIKSWFILPIIFGWLVQQKFKTTADRLNILKTIFYSSILVAIISIIYYFFGELTYDNRLHAFYLSPNHLAIYLSPGLVIGIWFLINKKNVITLLGCCLLLITIFLTYSQGAWLAIILSFVFLKSVQRFSISSKNKLYLLFAIFCLLLTTCYLLPQSFDGVNFLPSATHPRSSFSSRLMIWQSATEILKDNWLFGIGPGNFQIKYLEYQKYFLPYLEWAVPQPHNLYLAFWLQAGLLGVTGFLVLLFTYCKKLFSKIKTVTNANEKKLVLILLTLIFTILIHGLVDTPIWKNDLALIFWTIIFMI